MYYFSNLYNNKLEDNEKEVYYGKDNENNGWK